MSIFDSIKNALGGNKSEPEEEMTMAPSQMLRNAGIDTSGLDLSFSTDTITVSGEVPDEATRDKVLEVLSGVSGISTIEDSMEIAPAEAAAPSEPAPAPAPEPSPDVRAEPAPEVQPEAASEDDAPAAEESGARTYTVKSGDTLGRIAQEFYGKASLYPKIFEANRNILDNPDRIYPGQELVIPPPED